MNSRVPFEGPIAGVRVGLDGEDIIPIHKSMDLTSQDEKMNYVVAGDGKVFTMIDAGAYEVPEEKVLESMEKSFEFMQPWLKAQEDFLNIVEPKDKTYTSFILQDEVVDAVLEILGEETIKGNLTAGDSKIHDETKKELYEKLEG